MGFSADLLLAFALFAFVTSITPGPNNTMLLTSGLNFGFRRSIPHMLGISCGFGVMVAAVGLGLGAVFKAWPLLYGALRYVGAAYLLYLAWKIATADPASDEFGAARPMGFWAAAAFQWVNPKGWIMAVGAIGTYTPQQHYFANVLLIALLFAIINAPSVCIWVSCGRALRSLLQMPHWRRWFNLAMAALLVASLYPMLT